MSIERPLNLLIVGNGGREHALAWKARQSQHVARIFVAPGNAGTALEKGIENVAIHSQDIQALLRFAKSHAIDLTLIGPELPLALGITDLFTAHGLRCFGPTQAAAQLESSKSFCKAFMNTHGIPTAPYAVFNDTQAAIRYLSTCRYPLVIKADGLAYGKGVTIAPNREVAVETVQTLLGQHGFNEQSTNGIVIESYISGEELSFIVVTDGISAVPLATSQDHKRRDNADQGPNTGGMGAYSPSPLATEMLQTKIMQSVIYPTLQGMAAAGTPYCGFLYAGLMITASNDLFVLEFNCRLGDPETQVLLMRLNSDLITLCLAALEKGLDNLYLNWDPRPALGVVMASQGYPDHYVTGDTLRHSSTLLLPPDCKVFHAGTALEKGVVKTTSGRVLCATALGDCLSDAQIKAYQTVKSMDWDNAYYRTDIGDKAILQKGCV